MVIEDEIFIVQDELEIHPIALLLPGMDDDQYVKFKEDILGNGVLEPIILFQGKVLDGRHRYKASRELGIDIDARNWEGGMDPVEYVVSRNLHRRHLTPGQRSMVAAKCMDWHSEQARLRQIESGKAHSDNLKKGTELASRIPEDIPEAGNEPAEDHEDVTDIPKEPISEPVNQPDRHEQEAREQAAKLVGVSGRTVGDAKVILDHGTDEEKKAVESGNAGVTTVAKAVRERVKTAKEVNPDIQKPERKKPEYDIEEIKKGIFIQRLTSKTKPTFNETNESIEWAKWSWNPVTGCKFGCDYCYARKIAENSRYESVRPTGFEPTFHPDRLECPNNHKIPEHRKNEPGINNVFLCSMADLWGEWIPSEWIQQILDVISQHPEYNFISLTKNPKRYLDFIETMPSNIWIGATADTQKRFDASIEVFREIDSNVKNIKFLSCEPLTEFIEYNLDENYAGCVDWVIIGGLKGSENTDRQPKWSWVENLILFARESDASVYFKTNLTVVPKEFPDMRN